MTVSTCSVVWLLLFAVTAETKDCDDSWLFFVDGIWAASSVFIVISVLVLNYVASELSEDQRSTDVEMQSGQVLFNNEEVDGIRGPGDFGEPAGSGGQEHEGEADNTGEQSYVIGQDHGEEPKGTKRYDDGRSVNR